MLSSKVNFKTQYAVDMTCQSCVDDIKERLSSIHGVESIDISLKDKQVIIQGSAPPSKIKKTLEDSGRNVIVRGAGTTDGSNFGAAVCIFEFAKTTSNTHGDKPFQAQGLARIVQVHESLSFFDITVSGLKPGEYTVGIHSSGDMSNIPTSCGGLFRRIFGGALPDAHKPAGDLGTMIVGENGWGDLVVESEEIKVYEIIGRSMLIQSKPGSPSSNAPSTTSTPSLTCLAGIIARSAGLFQNDKQICACSGATMWEEQRISRSNGGGGRK